MTDDRLRMGRARFSSGSTPAWIPAAAIGTVIAILIGAIAAGISPTAHFLAFAVFAVCLWSPVTMICWAVLVDRESMRGAVSDPEESVESSWYDKSAQGAFHDALIACGLGAGIFAFWPIETELAWVLMGVTVLLMCDFGIRYLINKVHG